VVDERPQRGLPATALLTCRYDHEWIPLASEPAETLGSLRVKPQD